MGIHRSHPDWLIEIVGTDLNTEALDRARRAVYTEHAVRHVQGPLLDEYFVRDGKTFVLKDAIKARVTFEFGNLTRTPMPSTGPQDVVFCKNVAIYFRDEVTRKLIEGLRDTLDARRLSAHGARRIAVADVGPLLARRARSDLLLQEDQRRPRENPTSRNVRRKPPPSPESGRGARSLRTIRLVPRGFSRRRLGRSRIGASARWWRRVPRSRLRCCFWAAFTRIAAGSMTRCGRPRRC